MTDTHNEIISEIKGSLGVITLNRPKALNALSLGMILEITKLLQEWAHDPRVEVVYFRGAGERAFCAGGDIKQVYRDGIAYRKGQASPKAPVEILYHEYRMNRLMHNYPKPMAVYMHGITMGGGYGLAANCDLRMTAPDSKFAMPEGGIGFFTDVGSVSHLQTCPHHIGRYLVMSGETISASDMIYGKIATNIVQNEPNETMIFNMLEDVLKKIVPRGTIESLLEKEEDAIERHFAFDDPKVIVESLREDESEWTKSALALIQRRSPVSVAVCAEHYRRASFMNFNDVMADDFTLAQHFMDHDDFYEGIRCVLIDREYLPHWSYENVFDVPDELVQSFFEVARYDLNDDRFNEKYN